MKFRETRNVVLGLGNHLDYSLGCCIYRTCIAMRRVAVRHTGKFEFCC